MSTLSTARVSTLLDRLFTDADATMAAVLPSVMQIPADERAAVMSSKTNYRELYATLKDAHLAVSRETGALLYMLARSTGARDIVEFGTSFGLSTLHLAAALRDNGGGRLITSEFEPSKVARARENFVAGGLADLIEIREGDALETLARDLPPQIDLLLLDGAKGLYSDVLALVEDRLRPGAFILADNADWSPEYLARVRSPEHGYMSTQVSGDVELSMRIS
ncbi:Methyltransferase domain-containing protein [Rhodoblastus acidophilus]|uniref:Methyltransferase domain-containing protein n=1 Tax=Rhodoblastus acidophilus TaxID=1074 RepID=A0A212S8E3_RHOAC|nr:class I SAM-dependent methyltransferase [Rhodoblastus acidophilus]PPQ36855.1 methyltransferase [Rhodoblastus acidophilus]RAI21440.1 methyltransferase [Rhodoblastus acidophilus]SNB81626.1 Methyltransferase domain-containing protein [Rhodoblastus acidophilus]